MGFCKFLILDKLYIKLSDLFIYLLCDKLLGDMKEVS